MIEAVVEQLTEEEKRVLERALKNLNRFFRDKAMKYRKEYVAAFYKAENSVLCNEAKRWKKEEWLPYEI